MKNLWSIRMRASLSEIHISGAEGLYERSDIQKVIKRYTLRALEHPKGKPDKIVITIEDIKQKPRVISTLPVSTVNSATPDEGKDIATKLLQSLGISKRAIDKASKLIKRDNMRGAAVITAKTGERLEPDRERGVRVSRVGIEKSALKTLSSRLSRHKINTDTVKEALILASKVASCEDVIAELCASDDPYYTTGYVASKKFGYLRIPNIKYKGSKSGGRAFFVNKEIDIEGLIDYLEKTPVIVGKVASCKGIIAIDEILNSHYR